MLSPVTNKRKCDDFCEKQQPKRVCQDEDLNLTGGSQDGVLAEPSGPLASELRSGAGIPVGTGTRQGAKQWNEDRYATFSSANNKVVVGAIWDGHGGRNGLLAAQCARDTSLSFFQEHKQECESWTIEEWKACLTALFDLCHGNIRQQLLQECKDSWLDERGVVRTATGDAVHGGTTATVCVCIREGDGKFVLITANTGDSTGLLIRLDDGDADNKGENKCTFLTEDHGPESEAEYKRVQDLPSDEYPAKFVFVYNKSGVLRKYECPKVFRDDGVKDPRFVQDPWGNGVFRHTRPTHMLASCEAPKDPTCIAVTRALGNFYAQSFGLTAVPTINVQEVCCLHSSYEIVVASDGVWDCWEYEDFARFVSERTNVDAAELCEQVLTASIKIAVTNFGAGSFDDASLVCWKVGPEP